MRSIELCPTLDSSSDFAGTVPIMSSSDLIRLKKDSDFFLSGKKTLIGGVHQREKGWATWAFGVWLHSESERESIYVCKGEDNQSGRT